MLQFLLIGSPAFDLDLHSYKPLAYRDLKYLFFSIWYILKTIQKIKYVSTGGLWVLYVTLKYPKFASWVINLALTFSFLHVFKDE